MKSKLIFLSIAIAFGFAWLTPATPAFAATETLPGGFSFTAAGDYSATANTSAVLNLTQTLNPSFNLALGDFRYGLLSDTGWCDFVKSGLQAGRTGSAARVPFILIAGNHESDSGDGDISAIKQCLPFSQLSADGPSGTYAEQYYFDYPKAGTGVVPVARFIIASPGLDFKGGRKYDYSIRNKGTASEVKGAGYAYVESRIKEAKAQNIPWIIVGVHKVCVTTGAKPCEIGSDFANMLIEQGVHLVLAGHVHSYERSFPLKKMVPGQAPEASWIGSKDLSTYNATEGTIFNTIGTGGKEISSQNNSDIEKGYFASRYGDSRTPHFGASEFILNSTELRGKFIDSKTGAILDAFKITKSPSATPPNAPVMQVVPAAATTAAQPVSSVSTVGASTVLANPASAGQAQVATVAQAAPASCTNLAANMRYESYYGRTGQTMTDAKTGGAVTSLQNFLYAKGYLKVSPNGMFGPATRDAVAAFQAQYNIPANPKGLVGPVTREKIRDVSCGLGAAIPVPAGTTAKSISISSPAGNRADSYAAGSRITVAINDAIANPTRSASGMSYTVDLIQGNSVIQRFGTVYAASDIARHETVFTIAQGLNHGADYRVKVTPSCTSIANAQCRQAYSNTFVIYNSDSRSSGSSVRRFVEIVAPNGGAMATGSSQSLKLNIPSDKPYSVSYYLIPATGIALSGGGTYYDPVSGGYSLGGFVPAAATAQINATLSVPSDIPYGTYKLRVYLRDASETNGSPTMWTALAYDDSETITVGSPRVVTSSPASNTTTSGTAPAANSSSGTAPAASASGPYFKVLAPVAGYSYSSTTAAMTARWEWRNLPVVNFKVELANKLVSGHMKTVAENVDKNTNSATFKITDSMIQKFVEKSGGKTSDQIKASYYLKITGYGKGVYFTPKAVEGSSESFTVQSASAQ